MGTTTIRERPRIETDKVAAGKTRTSRNAAEVAQRGAPSTRVLVLKWIRERGEDGLTIQEGAELLQDLRRRERGDWTVIVTDNQISGRFRDLRDEGEIQDSGRTRETRSGCPAIVWVEVKPS